MKQTIKRAAAILGNLLISWLFSSSLVALLNNTPARWLVAAHIVIIAITGLILIGWCVPLVRRRLWFWRVNLVWVIGWLVYGLVIIGMLIIAINRLASLG